MTFKELFDLWYEHYARTVTTSTANTTKAYLNRHVMHALGEHEIDKIAPKQVLALANTISTTSTYSARRAVADIARMYDYAIIVLETTDKNPASRLHRYTQKHTVRGHKYCPIEQVPTMLQHIDRTANSSQSTKLAFWLIAYTAVRRQEAVLAKRDEFDFDAGLWHIPAHRMKCRKPHIVPLAPQVAQMVQTHLASHTSDWAFVSKYTDKSISSWSPYYLLIKAEYRNRQTLHGFRKIFSTHSHENDWNADTIELCLAHDITGVRGVYNHAKMLEQRRKLMVWYANEVDKWRGIGNV